MGADAGNRSEQELVILDDRETAHLEQRVRERTAELEKANEALRQSQRHLAAELDALQRLQDVSTRLIEADNIQDLYERIVDTAMALVHADFASMQLLEADGVLHLLAWRGFHPLSARFWETVTADSTSACGAALRAQARFIIDDTEQCALVADTPDLAEYRRSGIRSVQSTPLIARSGRPQGMISTLWRRPYDPSDDDLRRLDVLARQAADLIERKRAEEELRQQAEILRDLNEQLVITSVRQQEAEEERERLLGELAKERSWLRAVIDRSPLGIFLIEAAQGEHITVNRQAERLFGTPIIANAGMDQYQRLLFAADGSPLGHAELSYVRALAGEVITAEERLIRRSDGQTVPVLVSAGPIKDDWGNILGAVVIFDDITAIKEVERLREEWISIVTHDLRQPLTVIGGYAELLAMQLPSSGEPQREIRHIQTSVRNLRSLVDDLRDASQLETDRFTLNREWVDFPALVHSIVQREAEIVGDSRVGVIVDGEIPRVWVDPVRIDQVVTNFLTNAAKYGDPTPIIVSVNRRGEDVEVSVTNHGPGIARDDLPHVFSRFYRTRAAKQRRRGGLGLGLYIAKGIVEAHGGRIGVESIPSHTTTFHFTLPGQGRPAHSETGEGGAIVA